MSTPQDPQPLLGLSLGGPGANWPNAEDSSGAPLCSGRGCTSAAVWVLAWNNPKLHTPERRKTWLACEEHREHLSHFLEMRGFLKDVVPLAEWSGTGSKE